MTIQNIIDFVKSKKDKLYVGWPEDQIGPNIYQHIKDGCCVLSLDAGECIDGLILYRLDREKHNVWVSEAYCSTPGILGKLLELGCRNESIPLDGTWTALATRRKYKQRKFTLQLTVKTLKRLYTYGKRLHCTNTACR